SGEGLRVGGDTAPVDRRLPAAEQRADAHLQRMPRQPVAGERPAVRPAGGEESRMLAGAVVAEPALGTALLRTVLEVVDGRPGASKQPPHRVELQRLCLVRSAGDRELVVAEVG